MSIDNYKILGLTPNATQAEIRSAYKRLALLYHPDKNKSIHAQEKFKVMKKAYEILSDPSPKNLYDNPFDSTAQWSSEPEYFEETPKTRELSARLGVLIVDYNKRMVEHNEKRIKFNLKLNHEIAHKIYSNARDMEEYALEKEFHENEKLRFEKEKLYNELQMEYKPQVRAYRDQLEYYDRRIAYSEKRIKFYQERLNYYQERYGTKVQDQTDDVFSFLNDKMNNFWAMFK